MNSLTSLLEITHKSLLGDLCFFSFFFNHCVYFCYALAHRALALHLQCAFCSSHRSRRGIWGEQVSCLYIEHVTTPGHSESVVQPSAVRAAFKPSDNRLGQAGLSLWTYETVLPGKCSSFEQSVCRVTRLALQFSTGSCHSPPCLLDLGKSGTQPRKEHGSKAWAWKQMLKKKKEKEK